MDKANSTCWSVWCFTNQAGSFQLEVSTGSTGVNRVGVTGVGTWLAETSDNAISLNNWQYIVYTKNGTAQNIYVNGVNQSITINPYTFIDNADIKLIGQGTGSTQFFTGTIGSVSVYNRALTNSEISQNSTSLHSRFGL